MMVTTVATGGATLGRVPRPALGDAVYPAPVHIVAVERNQFEIA
jgi:hypothetical protein